LAIDVPIDETAMNFAEDNILIINSSTSVMQIALLTGNECFAEKTNSDRFRHAEYIFPMINELLGENKIITADIKAIIVSTGPGSFTGLRVGLASAKGLAISLGIPLVGVSIFNAISKRIFNTLGKTHVYLPSRRNEYYHGLIKSFDFNNDSITVVRGNDLAKIADSDKHLAIDCGIESGQIPGANLVETETFQIMIKDFFETGLAKLRRSGGDDIARLQPLYIQQFPAKKQ